MILKVKSGRSRSHGLIFLHFCFLLHKIGLHAINQQIRPIKESTPPPPLRRKSLTPLLIFRAKYDKRNLYNDKTGTHFIYVIFSKFPFSCKVYQGGAKKRHVFLHNLYWFMLWFRKRADFLLLLRDSASYLNDASTSCTSYLENKKTFNVKWIFIIKSLIIKAFL